MIDLTKSGDFFNPTSIRYPVHIIGCGSVGSHVALYLARSGITNFHLWDFDCVESHNIVNQAFTRHQVGKLKVDALFDFIRAVNDSCNITIHEKGWSGEPLNGYIFICVDSVQVRRQIANHIKLNPSVKALFDFRTGLTFAQHFAAENTYSSTKQYLETLNFSDADAEASTPKSACGTTLGVCTTVAIIAALGVNNFIRYVKGEGLRWFVQCDGFSPSILLA